MQRAGLDDENACGTMGEQNIETPSVAMFEQTWFLSGLEEKF
jgi:hypothetical protein